MKLKLAGVFGIALLALVSLLVGITIINAKFGNKYTQQVLSQSQQQYTNKTLPFKRGSITDRNGTMLANSVKVYNLILDCKEVNGHETYEEPVKEALETAFGIENSEIENFLENEETKESQYQILKKEVTMEEKKSFEEANKVPADEDARKALGDEELKRRQNVKGIYFEDTYKRVYPLESLACDVIGFTDAGNTATWGLEGYYNSTLNGSNGRKFGYLDENASLEQTIVEAVNGKNITTTLDASIQSIVENPNNGEILAMASSGTYDLNNPRDLTGSYTDKEIEAKDDEQTKDALFQMWKNYCVSQNFEPGSTVKPIVVAGALESGAITENSRFLCDGGEEIGEDYVKCAVYPDNHGAESLGEVIQNSCNDGMMAIGRKMGVTQFLEYQHRFNFGTRTGIDLPNEETGLLFTEDNMYEMELSTSAFGQGFNCTMIQEIAAMAAAINGGIYYQPHLVKEITDEDGKVVKSIQSNILKQPISEEVSADIREYMGMSVTDGTSKKAKVKGYSMGGKTGTAEKLNEKEKGNYLVSFIGFAPLDKPELLIYAVVDTPNVEEQATSSYPQFLAQAILSEVLPYMNIYMDEPTTEETVLWEGFYGVPKLTDIEKDGVSNPYGTILDQGFGDGDPQDVEKNDEHSDGITNEDAGIEEDDPEYEDDPYGMEDLEDDIRR